MSLLRQFEDSPRFADGIDLSAEALQVLVDNTRVIELVSQSGRDVWQLTAPRYRESSGIITSMPEAISDNPLEYGRWSFEMRTGLTTLTLQWTNTLGGGALGEVARVFINGVQQADVALTAGDQTMNYGITGLADRAIIEVMVSIVSGATIDAVTNPWGTYTLRGMYVHPVSLCMASAWPGSVSFGPLSTSNLNTLSNQLDWLAERLSLITMPLFQSVQNATGFHWSGCQLGIWHGWMQRGRNTRLRCVGSYASVGNVGETITLRINGTVVQTTGVITQGARGSFDWTTDISGYAADAWLEITLWSQITGDDPDSPEGRPSYYSLQRVWMEPASLTLAIIPATYTARQSATMSATQTGLNQLAAAAAAAYTRITTNAIDFDRRYCYRQNYGYNEGQRAYFGSRYFSRMMRRGGRRLVVRGSDVKIGWGAPTFNEPKESGGEIEFDSQYEETLIGSDELATVEIYLDTLEGLAVGRTYVLTGRNVVYAAEYLI